MLRTRADPQLGDVGLVDYCVRGTWCVVRGAWCVMRGCVLQLHVDYMVVLGVKILCRGITRGEAFVNRFASCSASASAPMGPNVRIHQLQPTATHSSPVTEKAHHSCPGL